MPDTTETPVTLRLSTRAKTRLLRQADESGKNISELASDLIERFVTRPSISEIMSPVHTQASESGMTDAALDAFLQGELEAHRREKKAKSA